MHKQKQRTWLRSVKIRDKTQPKDPMTWEEFEARILEDATAELLEYYKVENKKFAREMLCTPHFPEE